MPLQVEPCPSNNVSGFSPAVPTAFLQAGRATSLTTPSAGGGPGPQGLCTWGACSDATEPHGPHRCAHTTALIPVSTGDPQPCPTPTSGAGPLSPRAAFAALGHRPLPAPSVWGRACPCDSLLSSYGRAEMHFWKAKEESEAAGRARRGPPPCQMWAQRSAARAALTMCAPRMRLAAPGLQPPPAKGNVCAKRQLWVCAAVWARLCPTARSGGPMPGSPRSPECGRAPSAAPGHVPPRPQWDGAVRPAQHSPDWGMGSVGQPALKGQTGGGSTAAARGRGADGGQRSCWLIRCHGLVGAGTRFPLSPSRPTRAGPPQRPPRGSHHPRAALGSPPGRTERFTPAALRDESGRGARGLPGAVVVAAALRAPRCFGRCRLP